MSGFTPGPWAVRKERVNSGFGLMVGSRDPGKRYTIAHIFKTINVSPETIEADARLIASAPDLLAALTRALPYVETAEADEAYKPGEVAKVTAMIRAAIRQAEGGE